jgi:hypothetical protein
VPDDAVGGASKSLSTNSTCWLTPTVANTRRVSELKKLSAISPSLQWVINDE